MMKKWENFGSNIVVRQQYSSSEYRTREPAEVEGNSVYAAATAAAVVVGRRSMAGAWGVDRQHGVKPIAISHSPTRLLHEQKG